MFLLGNPISRLRCQSFCATCTSSFSSFFAGLPYFFPPRCQAYPGLYYFTQVQRQLQLRIEAQGKYLQTILEKAKETLGSHIGASPGLKVAHEELTELASKVNSEPMKMTFPPLALPELPTNSEDTGIANLPRQQSRVSDSSSQKSYVTHPSANPEDSGGASASCENQASTGTTLN